MIEIQNHSKIKSVKDKNQFIFDAGKLHIKEKSELAEALAELNKDIPEDQSGMTGIDMRANLHFTEISAVLTLDILSRLAFLPPEITWLTRQKKRLSASKSGIGRQQIVQLATGNQDKQKYAQGLIGVALSQAREENKVKMVKE